MKLNFMFFRISHEKWHSIVEMVNGKFYIIFSLPQLKRSTSLCFHLNKVQHTHKHTPNDKPYWKNDIDADHSKSVWINSELGGYKVQAFLVSQTVKRLPTMQEVGVRSLGREDPLEKEMATHSSILAWKIPWAEETGMLQSVGSQRVGHDWATSLSLSKFKQICQQSK